MLGAEYREEDIPHRLYFVNDAETLAQRHAAAHEPLLGVPAQNNENTNRNRCDCAFVLCSAHLITPKSTLSRLLQFRWLIIALGAIALIDLFAKRADHYDGSAPAPLWTEWVCCHPYAIASAHFAMTVFAIPFSFATVIASAFAFYFRYGIAGVAVSMALSAIRFFIFCTSNFCALFSAFYGLSAVSVR